MDYYDLDELYYKTFGDWFPNMCFMSDSDEELMKKMKRCIDTNTPAKELYKISYEKGIKY